MSVLDSGETLLIPEPNVEAVANNTLDYFPVADTEPFLEEWRKAQPEADGIKNAARLVLSETAVSIHFVDVSKPADWVPHENPPSFERVMQLAFNDHGGGSESGFRILLNRFVEGHEPAQYVLLSPPDAEGKPRNTTFHQADFTFPHMEGKDLHYKEYTPNPLKTEGQAARQGRNYYHFFLFGDSSTPFALSEAFARAGFSFDPKPMSLDRYYEVYLGKPDVYKTEWPAEQFTKQIAQLEATGHFSPRLQAVIRGELADLL
jgi:hypothetical protein